MRAFDLFGAFFTNQGSGARKRRGWKRTSGKKIIGESSRTALNLSRRPTDADVIPELGHCKLELLFIRIIIPLIF